MFKKNKENIREIYKEKNKEKKQRETKKKTKKNILKKLKQDEKLMFKSKHTVRFAIVKLKM